MIRFGHRFVTSSSNAVLTAWLPYFEVLLKTSRLSGTSLSADVLAYRTYPELH
jgi:hypothetical protein